MKRFISLFLCAVLMLGCLGTLVGCGEKEEEEVKDEGAQIAVYLGDKMYDFDPSDLYVSDNVAQVMNLLFEPLFRLNAKGKLEKAAAKRYKINKKERTVVITIRNTYFSDGTRVAASNFIYAWRDRILAPERQSAAAPLLYDIENAVEIKNGTADPYSFGAEATGIYELTIHYREGADVDQLLKNLANVATSPVLDSCVMTSSYGWSKATNTCVGNGPFKVSTMSVDKGIFSLERNKGYHQPSTKKNYDKFVKPYTLVSFWDDNEQAVTELTYEQIKNKALFFMGEATLETCKNFKKKAKTADTMSDFAFIFNTASTNAYLADPHVRKALSLALDRKAIADAVAFGKAANGLIGGSKKGIIAAGADTAAAQAELAKATATGSKEFTLTVNDDEISVAIAEAAKAAWSALGFNVTVNAVDDITSNVIDPNSGENTTIRDSAVQALIKDAAVGTRNFDVIGCDWQTFSEDKFVALCAFTTDMNGNGAVFDNEGNPTANGNVAGWSNADYDALVKEAMTLTGKDRTAKLDEAEAKLLEECPVIPVLFNQNYAFVGGKLSGVKTDGFGNFLLDGAKLSQYKKYVTVINK